MTDNLTLNDAGVTVSKAKPARSVRKMIAAVAIVAYGVGLISAAVYLAPRCRLGQPSARIAGMLIAGCSR